MGLAAELLCSYYPYFMQRNPNWTFIAQDHEMTELELTLPSVDPNAVFSAF